MTSRVDDNRLWALRQSAPVRQRSQLFKGTRLKQESTVPVNQGSQLPLLIPDNGGNAPHDKRRGIIECGLNLPSAQGVDISPLATGMHTWKMSDHTSYNPIGTNIINTIAVPAQVIIVIIVAVASGMENPDSDGSQLVYSMSSQHFVLEMGTETLTVLLFHRVLPSIHFFTLGGTTELP